MPMLLLLPPVIPLVLLPLLTTTTITTSTYTIPTIPLLPPLLPPPPPIPCIINTITTTTTTTIHTALPFFISSATASMSGVATQVDPDDTDKYLVSSRTPLLLNPRNQPAVRVAARMPPPLIAIPISLEGVLKNPGTYTRLFAENSVIVAFYY